MPNIEPTPVSNFFVTGGTLPADAGSYVERQADKDLLAALLAGEYCYVLNSRQMGKSSLSVRTIGRLNEAGVRTAFLDLTRFGGGTVTPEQWYTAMIAEIGRALDLRKEMLAHWKEHQDQSLVPRFFGAIQELGLESPLVLFIDEIDAVKSLPFSSDEFFAGLRECYNRRVTDETMKRLTVCLVGSATPSDLIADTRTSPFNIGKRIELRDFTLEECGPLADGLIGPIRPIGPINANHSLLQRVFHWTNGHPYLTQSICAAIAEKSSVGSTADVDRLVEGLFLEAKARERNPNLADVSNRILSSYLDPQNRDEHRSGILDLYGKVLKGREHIADDETNRLVALLKLAGIVRSEGGRLVVRNRIYAKVFDKAWIEQSMPDAELRRQRGAYRRGLVRALAASTVVISAMAVLTVIAFISARKAELAGNENLHNLYFANMNVIQGDYAAGNFTRINALLEETRDSPHRGWEWGYWNRLMHLDRLTLRGHKGTLYSACYSPDATKILTSSWDSTAKVWEARTGAVLHTLASPQPVAPLWSACYARDGTKILTLHTDKTARIWDADKGRVLLMFRSQGQSVVGAFSPDGKSVALADLDGFARVYNAKSGHKQLEMKAPGSVSWVEYTPSGDAIVTSSWAGTASVFDSGTGKQRRMISGHTDAVQSCRGSKDGRLLATAGWDKRTKIWDASSGVQLCTIPNDAPVFTSSFSPDGRLVVTGDLRGVARVWEWRSSKLLFTFRGHGATIWTAEFSADGSQVLTASEDGTAKVWDMNGPTTKVDLAGHTAAILSVEFSTDCTSVVTGSDDNTARTWNPGSGSTTRIIEGHQKGIVRGDGTDIHGVSARFFSNSSTIATLGVDGSARIWDAGTGKEKGRIQGKDDMAYALALSPDGRRLVTGTRGFKAVVWDVVTGQRVGDLVGHSAQVITVAFSPDGLLIATGSWDGHCKLWNSITRDLVQDLVCPDSVNAVAFSSDSKRVATGCSSRTVRVWDTLTGKRVYESTDQGSIVYSVAFSPDGSRIAMGLASGDVSLIEATSGRLAIMLKAEDSFCRSVAFSPDGTRIVSGNRNGLAHIWFSHFRNSSQ